MAYEKKVPEWGAVGSEPPDSLKESGFQVGYKPPADYFNWFWHGVSEALKELQEKAQENSGDSFLQTTGGEVTGTLILSKVADADGDAYNSPALVVGGTPDTYHVEIDNNEIQAKLNETTVGNLFLNSNGGKVTVGEGGLENRGHLWPVEALKSNFGTAELPWNRISGRYVELYGAANALYGRFRVVTTGTEATDGVTTLAVGNEIASGTANNASGKITVYGKGTGFTNIVPNTAESGSNTVTLPTATGTMAVYEAGTTDLTAGSSVLANGKLYFVYE